MKEFIQFMFVFFVAFTMTDKVKGYIEDDVNYLGDAENVICRPAGKSNICTGEVVVDGEVRKYAFVCNEEGWVTKTITCEGGAL